MKNILLISLAVFTLFACSKEDEYAAEKERLEGFWLLTDVTGGIAGTGYEANFDHLQINDNDRYSLMVHDSFIQEGTYELSKEDDQLFIRFFPNATDTLIFDDQEKAITFDDEDTKLTLTDPCCDLYVYHFDKDGE